MKSKSWTMRLAIRVASLVVLISVIITLAPSTMITQTVAGYEPARAQRSGPPDRGPMALLPDTTFKLYLPLVLSSSGNVTPPPGATNTPVPQPGGTGGLFLNTSNYTNSPKVMIDGSGGIHMAYSAYGTDSTGKAHAYYAYCASNCGSSSSWGIASFGDKIDEVELALTKAGHPRMLLYGNDASWNRQFQYAACDSACTSSSSWKFAAAETSEWIDGSDFDHSHFSFALDNLDRPRFVYQKYQGGGAMYAYCDAADCASSGTWSEVEIAPYYPTTYTLLSPSLAFTSDGKARMAVGMMYPDYPSYVLAYWTCDSACNQAGNWWYLPLYDGNGAEFVLRLDSQNRPRMAIYQGVPASGTAGLLYFAACDTNCTNGANWSSTDINLPAKSARVPDLALDAQGRPRIAYHDDMNYVAGYAWCNSNCSTDSAGWQHTTAEPNSALEADFAPPIPISCSSSYWYSGNRPSLALNSAGSPRIGHEAVHLHGGTCNVGDDFHAVRLTYFSQP